MALNPKKALLDIRKARRATKLRGNDEDVVANTLERIMQEAIVLQESGTNTFSKSALKEMRQIRKDLVAGQIDAGTQQAAYIGKFSSILDNIDNIDSEIKSENKKTIGSGLSSLKDSLPSFDTLTSAVMTANPVLGYAGNMVKDLMTSKKQQKRQFEEERKRRLQSLLEEQNIQDEQLKNEEMQSEVLERDLDQLKNPETNDIYIPYLERIELAIERFNEAFGIENPDDEETLSEIKDGIDEQNKLQRESIEQQKSDALESQFESSDNTSPELDLNKNQNEGKDLFGDEGGGLFGGITAGFSALIGPFLKVFEFLKKGGKMFMKFGKFTGILAIVQGIYDFVEGIFNAEEILGRGDLNITDRILVGISNVVSGLVSTLTGIVDWVAGLFGVDEIFGVKQEELTKKIFGWFTSLDDWFLQGLDYVKELTNKGLSFASDTINSMTNFFESIYEWVESKLSPILEWITEKIDGITNFGGDLIDGAKDTANSFWDTATGFFSDDEDESSNLNIEGGRTNNPNLDAKVEKVRRRAEQSRERYYGDGNVVNERVTNSIEKKNKELTNNNNTNSGGNAVIAPSSNQTNINNNKFEGSKVSENQDPTHRRFNQLNGLYNFSY